MADTKAFAEILIKNGADIYSRDHNVSIHFKDSLNEYVCKSY